jgi:predicted GNAT family N-acyltransferase
MQVETLDARTLSDADARAIAELLVRVWPDSHKTVEVRQQQLLDTGRDYDGVDQQAPRSFVIREAGQVIAHSAVIPRTIGTTDGELTIAGLGRVCTDPDQRGSGMGAVVVRPVFELVDQGLFSFSLFQTTTEVSPFYERLRCTAVDNPIVNSLAADELHSPFWDKVIMRYPDGPGWPEGEIDLRGPGY